MIYILIEYKPPPIERKDDIETIRNIFDLNTRPSKLSTFFQKRN